MRTYNVYYKQHNGKLRVVEADAESIEEARQMVTDTFKNEICGAVMVTEKIQ